MILPTLILPGLYQNLPYKPEKPIDACCYYYYENISKVLKESFSKHNSRSKKVE